MNNISAAVSHRLLKFVLNESSDIDVSFHGQKCKLSYLHNSPVQKITHRIPIFDISKCRCDVENKVKIIKIY